MINALATYRLTRLMLWDSFPPVVAAREKLFLKFKPGSPMRELLACPWCISIWIAFGVLGLERIAPKLWKAAATALAMSAVAGMLSDVERALE